MKNNPPIISFSVGDINGIGVEVFIKTFKEKKILTLCTPVLYANKEYFLNYADDLNYKFKNIHIAKNIDNVKPKTLNIINIWEEKIKINYGIFEEKNSTYSIKSINQALKDIKEKKTAALITLPVNKNIFKAKKIVGHTEYISNFFNKISPLMMMCKNKLKICIATTHVPIKNLSKKISKNLIKEKLKIFNESLINDFKIKNPKIAILGLNPHAGDNGKIGFEEKNIIIPLIKNINKKISCFGPFAADSFFGSLHYKNFDGIMSLYHDQGLVAFKTLCFQKGVNFTAGIPIIRCSPDHGCGYDIAGENLANENSLKQSVYLTLKIIKNRNA